MPADDTSGEGFPGLARQAVATIGAASAGSSRLVDLSETPEAVIDVSTRATGFDESISLKVTLFETARDPPVHFASTRSEPERSGTLAENRPPRVVASVFTAAPFTVIVIGPQPGRYTPWMGSCHVHASPPTVAIEIGPELGGVTDGFEAGVGGLVAGSEDVGLGPAEPEEPHAQRDSRIQPTIAPLAAGRCGERLTIP